MVNLNIELYKRITNDIITAEINKLEAKYALANILEEYDVRRIVNNPRKYDLRYNVKVFLKDKERQGASKLTIESYGMQLNIFANMVNKKVQDITKDDITDFLDKRANNGRVKQMTTMETIRSILRSFFSWLEDEDIIDDNPMLKIKPYKLPKTMTKALTVEKLELVRDNCITPREKALVETLYSTGCRLEEVNRINIEDINWENHSIKVLGKGNKERLVFFSARCSIYLKKYLETRNDNHEALFVTERKPYRRLSRRSIQREIKRIGERVNMRIYPHIFRHTMATLMLNRGCPMSVVQELLGHDDLATTQTYAQVTYSHKQQSYEKYFHQ